MAFIGSLLGAKAPVDAQIQSPTNAADIKNAQSNATYGMINSNELAQAYRGAGGLQKQNDVYGQQQALAQQLQQQAMGQGPNPAQAQLAQATGANTANQAALMAGQRGVGANAGLMARQAAQQGGANQQQMAGQAATMSAQQQIAAQQALMQQQAQMQSVAGTQTGQALQGTQMAAGNALQGQGNLLGAQGQFNSSNVAMQSNMNQANQAQNSATMGLVGGLAGGLGAAAIMGGGPASAAAMGGGVAKFAPALVNPQAQGGLIGERSHVHQFISNYQSGGHVPGKPQFKGDNYANDIVPAMLSKGEVVIPNHVMQSGAPAANAAKFVAAILAKRGGK